MTGILASVMGILATFADIYGLSDQSLSQRLSILTHLDLNQTSLNQVLILTFLVEYSQPFNVLNAVAS